MTKDERLFRKAQAALFAVQLKAYYRYFADARIAEMIEDVGKANAIFDAAGERYDEAVRKAEREYDVAMRQIRMWAEARPVSAVSG